MDQIERLTGKMLNGEKCIKKPRCETGCGNNEKTKKKNKIGIESADDEVCSTLGSFFSRLSSVLK